MKKIILSATVLFLMQPRLSSAQTQAFAVSSISGILESKFILSYNPDNGNQRSLNYIADTISMAEAQSIFALNVIGRDTNKLMYKLQIKDFEMFIQDGNDTLTLKSKSDFLTDEMKNVLKKIRPGTEIYFTWINCFPWKGLYASTPSIKYIAM